MMEIVVSLCDWLLDPLRMLTSPAINVRRGSHLWEARGFSKVENTELNTFLLAMEDVAQISALTAALIDG